MLVSSGSTQEEMGALVQQSINDSKISGGDRPVAWDGETRTGAGLRNQLKQIQESKVLALETLSRISFCAASFCKCARGCTLDQGAVFLFGLRGSLH